MKSITLLCLLISATNTFAFTRTQSEAIKNEYIRYASPMAREAFPDLKRDLRMSIQWNTKLPTATPGYITGGLLKLSYMTADAVVLILCHELGHSQKMTEFFVGNLDFSGQEIMADYFAAAACLPNIIEKSSRLSRLPHELNDAIPLSKEIVSECMNQPPSGLDSAICIREAQAAVVTIEMLYREHFQDDYKKLGFDRPSFDRPWRGENDFLQCRLLNMRNGIFHRPPITCIDI